MSSIDLKFSIPNNSYIRLNSISNEIIILLISYNNLLFNTRGFSLGLEN